MHEAVGIHPHRPIAGWPGVVNTAGGLGLFASRVIRGCLVAVASQRTLRLVMPVWAGNSTSWWWRASVISGSMSTGLARWFGHLCGVSGLFQDDPPRRA